MTINLWSFVFHINNNVLLCFIVAWMIIRIVEQFVFLREIKEEKYHS